MKITDKSYFGVDTYDDKLIRLDDIRELQFYEK